jgi:predicted amidophosphoribosyltransferase
MGRRGGLVCSSDKPEFARARSALEYDEASCQLAPDLKHGERRDGAPTFTARMDLAAPFLRDANLIIPAPLRRMRRIQRGDTQTWRGWCRDCRRRRAAPGARSL